MRHPCHTNWGQRPVLTQQAVTAITADAPRFGTDRLCSCTRSRRGHRTKPSCAFTGSVGSKRGVSSRTEMIRDGSEAGIALIAVLWTLILLSIIAAALSLETRSSTRIARNMAENATARAAADSGIQRAILDL